MVLIRIMHLLFTYWVLLNVVGTFGIIIMCFSQIEYFGKSSIFFYPLLIDSLREQLSIVGTIMATIFISGLFLPAIITYSLVCSFIGIIYLFIKGFVKLFRKKIKN